MELIDDYFNRMVNRLPIGHLDELSNEILEKYYESDSNIKK